MENRKQVLLIVLAVVAGIIATAMTSAYVTNSIQQQTQQLKDDYDAKQKQTMAAMQQQSDQKLSAVVQEMQRMKAEQTDVMQRQIADMQGRIEAQQKKDSAAKAKKIKPSLAVKTPAGKRAVTISVESLGAVGGLLNPGDVVDVIAHLDVPKLADDGKKIKRNVTAMIFQGLEVLAVNTNLEETGVYYDEQQLSSALKITVAVDPQEAGLLVFAEKNGKLEMALRSPEETDHQMVKASTWKTLADYVLENQGADLELPDELKGIVEKKAVDQKPTIQIFRGGKEL